MYPILDTRVELHLPYCFYTKIQKKNHVWRNKKGFSRNNKKVVPDETSEVDRWKSMYRSYSYVCSNPTQYECIRLHVIFKREKFINVV